MKPADRERILTSADPPLPHSAQDAIINLSCLGVTVQASASAKKAKRDPKEL